MPYWSSSRVGAVPVGGSTTPSPNKSNNRRSLRKGITMEDLKKQTALRLAHEQGRGDGANVTTPVVETPNHRRINSPSKGAHHGATPYHQNRRTATATPDRPFSSQQSENGNIRSMDNVFRLEEPSMIQRTPPPSYSPSNGDRSLNRGLDFHRTPPAQTVSSSLSVDSVTEKGSNAKLPHGLTVHELKEMTKARLEAEAVQRGDVVSLMESHDPLVSAVRAPTEYRDHMTVRGAPSPLPQLSYGRLSSRSPFPADNDAWESASVSTSASDYPASESMYSNGLNGNASFSGDEAIPFGRSSSYPSNPGTLMNDWAPHERNRPPSFIAAPSAGYYDPGYAPNRRRAATLSPRPCLSYVHEDRPVAPGHAPFFPSECTPPSLQQRQQRQVPSRSRSAVVPEVLNYGQSRHQMVGFPNAGVIGDMNVGNNNFDVSRPRTFSAPSLPPISNTDEEFLLDNHRGGTPVHRFSSQFGSVLEDAPVESVSGLSDAFRSASPVGLNAESANLVGFGSTNSSVGLGSSMDSFGGDVIRMRAATSCDYAGLSGNLGLGCSTDPSVGADGRHRAATWGESSGLDLFCGHDLSDDLASILKLSGAETKDNPF